MPSNILILFHNSKTIFGFATPAPPECYTCKFLRSVFLMLDLQAMQTRKMDRIAPVS